jgi:hypothetical protein
VSEKPWPPSGRIIPCNIKPTPPRDTRAPLIYAVRMKNAILMGITLASLVGAYAAIPAHAKSVWIKGTSKVELKASASNSAATAAMLSSGEEVTLISEGPGIWSNVSTKSGKTGFVIRFATSPSPIQSGAAEKVSKADLESDSLKQLRSRRSGAATMGVRGLQARTDSGEAEIQDFTALEKLEVVCKQDDKDPQSRRMVSLLERELTPRIK